METIVLVLGTALIVALVFFPEATAVFILSMKSLVLNHTRQAYIRADLKKKKRRRQKLLSSTRAISHFRTLQPHCAASTEEETSNKAYQKDETLTDKELTRCPQDAVAKECDTLSFHEEHVISEEAARQEESGSKIDSPTQEECLGKEDFSSSDVCSGKGKSPSVEQCSEPSQSPRRTETERAVLEPQIPELQTSEKEVSEAQEQIEELLTKSDNESPPPPPSTPTAEPETFEPTLLPKPIHKKKRKKRPLNKRLPSGIPLPPCGRYPNLRIPPLTVPSPPLALGHPPSPTLLTSHPHPGIPPVPLVVPPPPLPPPLPLCPEDGTCARINDPSHQESFLHTCKLHPCFHAHLSYHTRLFRHAPGQGGYAVTPEGRPASPPLSPPSPMARGGWGGRKGNTAPSRGGGGAGGVGRTATGGGTATTGTSTYPHRFPTPQPVFGERTNVNKNKEGGSTPGRVCEPSLLTIGLPQRSVTLMALGNWASVSVKSLKLYLQQHAGIPYLRQRIGGHVGGGGLGDHVVVSQVMENNAIEVFDEGVA